MACVVRYSECHLYAAVLYYQEFFRYNGSYNAVRYNVQVYALLERNCIGPLRGEAECQDGSREISRTTAAATVFFVLII